MSEKILFVDDEVNILESLKRELGSRYEIETALSGMEGLEKLTHDNSFAVVVADYRMPRMDGIKFLTEVMLQAPDTVRMMLTGNADLQTAMDAVNEGQIFRLLTKPCPPGLLSRSLDAGLKQYRLIVAEKELLEKTLVESINMLTEILSIINPKAYGKSFRVRQLVRYIAEQLRLPGAWQYEMAAALSQLGWIIFPPELLDKIAQNQLLSAADILLYSKHPFTAKKLLEKIPRLELIARIIEGQTRSIEDLCLDEQYGEQYFIDVGAHILNVCLDYDQLILRGHSHDLAVKMLIANQAKYKPDVLTALGSLKSAQVNDQNCEDVEIVSIEELETGMILVEPVRDIHNNILLEKNTLVTRSTIVLLLKLSTRPEDIIQPLKIVRGDRSAVRRSARSAN